MCRLSEGFPEQPTPFRNNRPLELYSGLRKTAPFVAYCKAERGPNCHAFPFSSVPPARVRREAVQRAIRFKSNDTVEA